MLILAIIGIGLGAGWLAQILLGRGTKIDGRTLAAGLIGSFVGGLLVSLIAGDGIAIRPSGFVGSVIGAVIVLALWGWLAPKGAPARRR